MLTLIANGLRLTANSSQTKFLAQIICQPLKTKRTLLNLIMSLTMVQGLGLILAYFCDRKMAETIENS